MNRNQIPGFCGLVVTVTVLLLASRAQAGGSPAMQWGSMNLPTSVGNCLSRADKALSDAGVGNTQQTGWQWYGERSGAAVLVACSALSDTSSYLVVIASSDDSSQAELLRNDVRARIAAMSEFD
jgi:hypothetical protein